jgi:tetratricopeptide (TPR) repeat protein
MKSQAKPSGLSLLFVLFLFFGVTLPAGAQMGGLEGEVRDYDGKPMPGVTIQFDRLDIKMHFEIKTDKKGRYLHAALPGGSQTRYAVRLIRDGEVLFKVDEVNVPLGEPRRLDINLQEERKRQEGQLTEEQRRQREQMRRAEEHRESMEQHFYLGREYVQQQKYPEAIAEFEAAAALDPSQPAVFANLGVIYTATNQNEKAIEAYEKAIALNPEDAGLHNNLGLLYAKTGRMEEAGRATAKAAELNPAEAHTYYTNQGIALYNAGHLAAAIDPLRKATELDPNQAETHYWLGVCLYSTAESKIEGGEVKTILKPGTREAFERYLELAPDGRFSNDAKAMLAALDAQVPTSLRLKKK